MDILYKAQLSEINWKDFLRRTSGYNAFTTFWSDFTIADLCRGKEDVIDTYERAFEEWKTDVRYFTELTIVLNHKIWEHYDNHNEELSRVYDTLWKKAMNYADTHFKSKDLAYFYETLN